MTTDMIVPWKVTTMCESSKMADIGLDEVDGDPVLTLLLNILRGLEEEEKLSNQNRRCLRLVARARRDRIFSAPEIPETDDDDDDVDFSCRKAHSRSIESLGTMNGSTNGSINGYQRPSSPKEGPSLKPGSSLKRNTMVHERPRRLNGLSASAERITCNGVNLSSRINGMRSLQDLGSVHNGSDQFHDVRSLKKPAPPPPTSSHSSPTLSHSGSSSSSPMSSPPPPLPKSRPPTPRQMSLSELVNPDRTGWLQDQEKGEQVWCMLADMLFCVFDSDKSSTSRVVIFLPGCRVRSLVYNSPKRNSIEMDNPDCAKTISGADKYQFYIENISVRRKYLFGTRSRRDLDAWVEMLTIASDIAMVEANGKPCRSPEGGESSDDSVFPASHSSYYPSPTTSRRMSMISISLKEHELNDSRSEAIIDFRKRLRKEPDYHTVAPVKGLHNIDSFKETKKSRSFLKLRSFGSLDSLLKRKRSKHDAGDASADRHSLDDTKSLNFPDSNSGSPLSSRQTSPSQSMLSRSWDSGKSSNGLGSSLRRRASDLKDKMFGSSKRALRSPGLRLRDFTDIRINGHLQYKFMMRWIKVWCVVSRGCFYGFKSQQGDENPVLAVMLTQSTVSYVTEADKRNKKLYVFKLSQPHCKSIYLCAQEENDLSRWLQTLQMEACRIQADDNLALESTSDCNYSVDSALSAMSVASSRTDISDNSNVTTADYVPGMYDFPGNDTTGRRDSSESADDWDNSSQSSTNDLPHPRCNDTTPTHDPSVSYLWGKDKGYLLQVIRAKLRGRRSATEGDCELYDREVPRQDGGGSLLLLDDDSDTRRKKGLLGSKSDLSRSFNDISYSRVEKSKLEDTSESRGRRAKPRPLAVRKLPAQELKSPTLAGYLERKGFNGQWIRYWYVLKGGFLYCYLTSEDQITVDITHLHCYQVTSLIDQFRGKKFVIHLSHENYIPVYLSLESHDEMDTWSDALTHATQLPAEEYVEELDTRLSSSLDKGDSHTKLLTVKQKLLAEVLRQKEELEKKQAARRLACQNDPSGVYRRGCHNPTSNQGEGDVHISTVTRLKQRRMSTQIKMEALQRQLGEGIKNGQKKSLFKIGKKKSQEEKNPQLVEQLKELSTTLQEIDINLNSEGVLTKNNVMSSTVAFQKIPEMDQVQKGDSFEDEQAVYRSNSLKASVQRLAHRTFAKAGWRKNTKKSQSLHFEEYHPDDPQFSPNQEMIDLTSHSADIISTISFSSSADLMSVGSANDLSPIGHHPPSSPRSGRYTPGSVYTPSPPASPASTSVTSFPTSPRSVKSSPRDRGLDAARAEMMKRSYSAGASLSTSSCETEPSSPRREVNPSIMAEIDAFEELTKQVLSQRSALASH